MNLAIGFNSELMEFLLNTFVLLLKIAGEDFQLPELRLLVFNFLFVIVFDSLDCRATIILKIFQGNNSLSFSFFGFIEFRLELPIFESDECNLLFRLAPCCVVFTLELRDLVVQRRLLFTPGFFSPFARLCVLLDLTIEPLLSFDALLFEFLQYVLQFFHLEFQFDSSSVDFC